MGHEPLLPKPLKGLNLSELSRPKPKALKQKPPVPLPRAARSPRGCAARPAASPGVGCLSVWVLGCEHCSFFI